MAPKSQTATKEQDLADTIAADYAQSMFQDGHNRTETNKKAHDAPAYDKAAHTVDPELEEQLSEVKEPSQNNPKIYGSRDGTEASGTLDEDGGSLGGTEKEIDDLEATGAPVDRTPQMKA